jgi:flagellar hook-associated protein FlgK
MRPGKVKMLEKSTKGKNEIRANRQETADAVTKMQQSLEPFLKQVEEVRRELEDTVAKGEKEVRQSTSDKVNDLVKELASANKEFAGLSSASFKTDVNVFRKQFDALVKNVSDKQQVLNNFEKEDVPFEVRIKREGKCFNM